jgi:predicted nucleic acid-binding protein
VRVYLDASAVLRVLLRQAKALTTWGRWDAAYSSELLGLEARRVLDRLRLAAALDDHGVADAHRGLARIERAIGAVPVTRPVLQRAGLPMPTAVKTLDAIHLASALLLRERRVPSLVFVTHDPQQARAARALGFECLGA